MHAQRLGPLPTTWTARTPDGFTQFFFSHADPDAPALRTLRDLGPGVHVAHRGYVLAPPSRIDGRRSAWHFDGRPGRAPLATMPEAWMDRLTGRQMPPDGLSGLDARHSILGRAFERLGWLGRRLDDGRRIARCPWMHEHVWPGGAGGDSATVLLSPESDPQFGRLACQHPECAKRNNWHLMGTLPLKVLEAARADLPIRRRDPLLVLDDELDLTDERARQIERELIREWGPLPDNGSGLEPTPSGVCH
jgi:hypothetical protein